MYNILLCDDEPDIVAALEVYLDLPDYRLFTARNGLEAVQLASRHELHLILLDIMMPVLDGISAMQKIREITNTPIILLTAKGEDVDKVLGLNAGADDYVTKPFNPVELQARVKSQLRRYTLLGSGKPANSQIRIGGILLDDMAKSVSVDGEAVNLTPTEYEILLLLMRHPDQVFSPERIYQMIWQEQSFGSAGTVAVHIRHLREKIEINPARPNYLLVVWGQGYKFTAGSRREKRDEK